MLGWLRARNREQALSSVNLNKCTLQGLARRPIDDSSKYTIAKKFLSRQLKSETKVQRMCWGHLSKSFECIAPKRLAVEYANLVTFLWASKHTFRSYHLKQAFRLFRFLKKKFRTPWNWHTTGSQKDFIILGYWDLCQSPRELFIWKSCSETGIRPENCSASGCKKQKPK